MNKTKNLLKRDAISKKNTKTYARKNEYFIFLSSKRPKTNVSIY